MIVIKIELHSAITGQVTELGKAVIDNVGAVNETHTRFNYRFRIGRKGSTIPQTLNKPTRDCTIQNWPRDSKTVWQLLRECLNEAYE